MQQPLQLEGQLSGSLNTPQMEPDPQDYLRLHEILGQLEQSTVKKLSFHQEKIIYSYRHSGVQNTIADLKFSFSVFIFYKTHNSAQIQP